MRPRRVGALAIRIVRQIRRDHRSVGLVFIVPMLVMGLLGFLFRLEPSPIAVGVVLEDEGATLPQGLQIAAGQALVSVLEENEGLAVRVVAQEEGETLLRSGSLDVVLIFPADFSQGMLEGSGATLQVVLEGSNPGQTGPILAAVTGTFTRSLAALAPGGTSVRPPEVETTYVYGGENFDFLDSFAPVFIAFFAFFLVFLLTGISFFRERVQGTMERLMATPITRLEIVLGYMLGFGLFGLIQSTVVLFFTIFVLRIHYVGSLALAYLVVGFLALGAVNLGIFLSTYSRTELQVMQFYPIVIVPQVLLAGILVPVEDLPTWLQGVAYLMPLTYANRAMTDVMIRGFGLADVAADLGVLLLFALGALVVSALTLRRQFV
ncbi:MAG: ABC transporter permease [Anaerolineae bacterium]